MVARSVSVSKLLSCLHCSHDIERRGKNKDGERWNGRKLLAHEWGERGKRTRTLFTQNICLLIYLFREPMGSMWHALFCSEAWQHIFHKNWTFLILASWLQDNLSHSPPACHWTGPIVGNVTADFWVSRPGLCPSVFSLLSTDCFPHFCLSKFCFWSSQGQYGFFFPTVKLAWDGPTWARLIT